MKFADLVSTSTAVAATRSRLAKRDALADLLRRADRDDVEIVVAYLAGELRQRRTGVGWAALRSLPEAASEPSLELTEIDSELQRVSELAGPGSAGERTAAVTALFSRATSEEQRFLRGLLSGEIRQGALDAAMLDALAAASGLPLDDIRRAVMLRGATGPVAVAALFGSIAEFALTVGQPVRPMLAGTAPDAAAAMAKIDGEASVDVKLDGIRVQAHKLGPVVSLFTRSLDDITARLPEVVRVVRDLPVEKVILDGEVLALDADGRPRPFQETASRTASQGEELPVELSAFFFDILAVDDEVLIDEPLRVRLARLDEIVPSAHRIRRVETSDPSEAEQAFADAVAAGQEGVVVKDLGAPYAAGRRGAGWIKVKPRHTLDLVVLAVEWGSGRRRGLLSNIHMGARDPATGGFVMLGKTFKGMTDEMLAWQTVRFGELALDGQSGELALDRGEHVVRLQPVQVVEIAFDGLQRSTRYPGGLALRFARVLRYREDKTADEADTIDTVRALAGLASQ